MTLFSNMPSMGWKFWPLVKFNYEEIMSAANGVGKICWQVIIFEDEYRKLPVEALKLMDEEWIFVMVIPRPDGISHGSNSINHKVNAGLETFRGFDGFVWNTSDDNIMPVDCLVKFKESIGNKKVLVCSHKRGQRTTFHGHSDLIAAPHNVYPSGISGEQYITHMSLLKDFGYDMSKGMGADGYLIQKLYALHPEQFAFAPQIFLPFNAMEEGRWDKEPLFECTKSKTVEMFFK